jgi:hypothetical protein
MKKSCEKHPTDFEGYSPKEFAEKFVNTNYFYQQKVFEELAKKYKKESEGDYKRGSLKNPNQKRVHLASSLEKLSKSIEVNVLIL